MTIYSSPSRSPSRSLRECRQRSRSESSAERQSSASPVSEGSAREESSWSASVARWSRHFLGPLFTSSRTPAGSPCVVPSAEQRSRARRATALDHLLRGTLCRSSPISRIGSMPESKAKRLDVETETIAVKSPSPRSVSNVPSVVWPRPGGRLWMSDDKCSRCYDCERPFTTLRRRHHCRSCGAIYCNACSSNRINGRPFGYRSSSIRVCNLCMEALEPTLALSEEKAKKSLNYPETLPFKQSAAHMNSPLLQVPVGAATVRQSTSQRSPSPSPDAWSPPTSQVPSFSDSEPAARSGSDRPRRSLSDGCEDHEDLDHDEILSLRMESFSLAPNIASSNAETDIERKFAADDGAQDSCNNATRPWLDREAEELCRSEARDRALERMYELHLSKTVDWLVSIHGIIDWHDIIVDVAKRVGSSIVLDDSTDSMDVRNYVKFKRIPFGCRSESLVLSGVALNKNVAHRRMRTEIADPRVVLLGCALEYDRRTERMASLETLLQQEEEYVSIQVNKLLQLRPDVVVASQSVSRIARDQLLRAGVSLVLNVKPSVLCRLSRCTGASVLSSIEHASMIGHRIGTCQRFLVQMFSAGPTSKPLPYSIFEGCVPVKQMTVVIRGSDLDTLAKVKRVLSIAIHIYRNGLMEAALFADQQIGIDSIENDDITPVCNQSMEATLVSGSPRTLLHRWNGFPLRSSPLLEYPAWVSTMRPPINRPPAVEAIGGFVEDDGILVQEILFGCVWLTDSWQCFPPQNKAMRLYSDQDKSLGRFLREHCFQRNLRCLNRNCKRPMTQHVLCYAHASGRVLIHLHQLKARAAPSPNAGNIVVWTHCRACSPDDPSSTMSRATVLSDRASSLSFGKFLELTFYNHKVTMSGCGHSLHRHGSRCFASGRVVAQFSYDHMPPYEVSFGASPTSLGDNVAGRARQQRHLERRALRTVLEAVLDAFAARADSLSNRDAFEEESRLLLHAMGELERNDADVFAVNRLKMRLYSRCREWVQDIPQVSLDSDDRDGSKRASRLAGKDGDVTSTIPSYNGLAGQWLGELVRPTLERPDERFSSRWLDPTSSACGHFSMLLHQQSQNEDEHDHMIHVPIFDDEPSSWIAHALASPFHRSFISDVTDDALEITLHAAADMMAALSPAMTNENSSSSRHENVAVKFGDATSQTWFRVVVYYARAFHALRRALSLDDSIFLASLSRCVKWDSSGGKSGVSFARTLDERFVLKFIKRREASMYQDMAAAYFGYVTQAAFNDLPSVLTPILGLFEIARRAPGPDSSKRSSLFVVVMPNIFFNRNIGTVFDLKGSIRNRFVRADERASGETDTDADVDEVKQRDLVLLDENFMQFTNGLPIPLTLQSKERLRLSVFNDTLFLCDQVVVDYSILVGLDPHAHQLVVGIIDYLRQYTWDKQIETVVKSASMITGKAPPTVIAPNDYKARFRLAIIHRYFMCAPDRYVRAKTRYSRQRSQLNRHSSESSISSAASGELLTVMEPSDHR